MSIQVQPISTPLDLTALNRDPRILTLRARCRERKQHTIPMDGDPRLLAAALRATDGMSDWTLRRGKLTRYLLENLPLDLDDAELLLGRLAADRPEWKVKRAAALEYIQHEHPTVYTPGQTGHCQLDLSRLMDLGIDGLLADIHSRAAGNADSAAVYHSFADALAGLSGLCTNAAALAEASRATVAPERQYELAQMAAACRHVAHLPPATFREALQLTWLAILGCHFADRAWLVSPGRLDRFLWPYYQADIHSGVLDPSQALTLLESLYLLLNEDIPDGLAVAVMVGGRDTAGNDVTNPLSYLCLEAARRVRMIYPTVGVCWHAGTPQSLTDLAIDLVTLGFANPAFFGDDTIQRGLAALGVPPEEACAYINSTCVEITPCGASNVWVASPYFSLCQILLDEMAASAESGEAETFDEFLTSYRRRLSAHIAAAVDEQNSARRERQLHGGKPLQSVFTRDCLSRGLDIDSGGARYNWVECSFVGLANLCDSLYVIQEEVYNQGRRTLAGLNELLRSDFAGAERERQRFLKTHPKYGNNCAAVDGLVGEMVAYIRSECARYRMQPDDSPFVPGTFCWIMHERLGRECGATPDGRKAGFPFADGCGGAQGREISGPTAAALSVTSWDASAMIGGAAFNMKFPASLFSTAEAGRGLRELVLTFLRRGGFETQVNVVDARTLRAAQQDPDSFRDLIVRIGGYSDYFTRLSPEMQAEVILRTEYGEI
jgi:formate C-acetyltransferase